MRRYLLLRFSCWHFEITCIYGGTPAESPVHRSLKETQRLRSNHIFGGFTDRSTTSTSVVSKQSFMRGSATSLPECPKPSRPLGSSNPVCRNQYGMALLGLKLLDRLRRD